ncbi:WXG100 family type VII secretion target [Pseudactinotalea sp. Z1739]|uniref:WXG100 family type VII secretion target n=1 Tax=Pseudactinotalea sp. Z1739 TaxID=3413028 RepID=UPI003C7CFF04
MRIEPVADVPLWDSTAAHASEQLTVHGVRVQVDPGELRALAHQISRAQAELDQALNHARRAGATLESTIPYAPVSGKRAAEAVWTALARRPALSSALTSLAGDLRTAAREYLDREQRVRHYISTYQVPHRGPMCRAPRPLSVRGAFGDLFAYPGRVLGAIQGTVVESAVNRRWSPSGAQTGYLLRELTSIYDVGGALQGGSSIQVFASVVNHVTTAGVSTRVASRKVAPPPIRAGASPNQGSAPRAGEHPPPTTTVTGLVRNIGALYPERGAEPGTVRVDRLVAPDGTVSWQVLVPGTQSRHSFWNGPFPNDWASNVQVFARQDSAASAAVIAAMRAAGVGAGEEVLIAGHSQGGLVAADLAAREEVRGEFAISSVLTIGAPVNHIEIPEGVAVLQLEHTDDLVTGPDGRPAPITPERTTVTRDVTAASPWYRVGGVTQSHDIPAYAETAHLVDASTDPAVRNWRAASSGMLDPRTEVTSTYVQSVRVP